MFRTLVAACTVVLLLALPPDVRALEPVAQLLPDDGPEGGLSFGHSIAMDGDVIVVGSHEDNWADPPNSVWYAGSVYVFRRVGVAWRQEAKLYADPPNEFEHFGYTVAVQDDLLLAGTYYTTGEVPAPGKVYVFRRIGGVWTQQGTLSPSISLPDDGFGLRLAMDADRVAVGALGYQSAEPLARVFVFRWNGASWIEEGILLDPTWSPGALVASSLDIHGDLIVVGNPYDDDPQSDPGSAFVFGYDGSDWVFQVELAPEQPNAGSKFGSAVAVHDGIVLVGAPSFRFGPTMFEGGSVFEFRNLGGTWSQVARIDKFPLERSQYGISLAIDGSVLVVGDRTFTVPETSWNSAEVLDRVETEWVHRTSLQPLFPPNVFGGNTRVVSSGPRAVVTMWPVSIFCVGVDAACIPALSTWGVGVLGGALVVVGVRLLRRRNLVAVLLLSMSLAVPVLANDKLAAPHEPDRLLVRFRPGTAPAARAAADVAADAEPIKTFSCVPDLRLVEVSTGCLAESLAVYEADANVLYVEPDYQFELSAVPNDPLFDRLWGLQNTGDNLNDEPIDPGTPGADIRAVPAWDLWTGDPEFLIAVLDSGTDYAHFDLAQNMWVNPNEQVWDGNQDGCPGVCGVDDDGDGQIDEAAQHCNPDLGSSADDDENGWCEDIYGFDFSHRELYKPHPFDEVGHGTRVAGIIGAGGDNGVGVTGVNWGCKIVSLMIAGSDGKPVVSKAVEAVDFIIEHEIRLSNISWGGRNFSAGQPEALYDAFVAARDQVGHLFVAAAGNLSLDIDVDPFTPAAFDLDNIISVAAIDNDDVLWESSDYGEVSVDLGAPGVTIVSTFWRAGHSNQYNWDHGTSFAAPHVTGVAALVWGLNPQWDWQTVKSQILGSVRPVAALDGITVTGGAVDAFAALNDCNLNGIGDDEDVAEETSEDCNSNYWPDECDLARGTRLCLKTGFSGIG